MNEDVPQDGERVSQNLRRAVYTLLIITSLCTVVGRILVVRSADRRTPFLSANDRSRWCTIRALVESRTYVIDRLQQTEGWRTIDKVRHPGPLGQLHYYSSKPPLFPTLVAGEYWLIHQLTGATFARHPFAIGRTMLIVTNVLPLLLYLLVLAKIVERWGTSDWGRIFVMATAAWGTYLTTFAITLNNHLPAAVSTLLVLYALLKIWYEQRTNSWYFVLAGLASGFAAANELPALSLVVVVGAGLAWRALRQTLLCFVPALAVVALGFFLTNYLAHESLRPPYMHRERDDDWYAYPDSYWLDGNRQGVDRGEPSPSVYALHALVGHHGVFSLTPVWALSMIGLMMLAVRRDEQPMPALALLIALLTVVCLTFYLTRPLVDRNYGGVTSGFRWMFWFTPLWSFAMIPIADWLSASRWSRGVALALLSVSVISASYPALNPWSHPWLFVLGQYAGWIGV